MMAARSLLALTLPVVIVVVVEVEVVVILIIPPIIPHPPIAAVETKGAT